MAATNDPAKLFRCLVRLLGSIRLSRRTESFLTYDPLSDDLDDYRSHDELQRNWLAYCYGLPSVAGKEPGCNPRADC